MGKIFQIWVLDTFFAMSMSASGPRVIKNQGPILAFWPIKIKWVLLVHKMAATEPKKAPASRACFNNGALEAEVRLRYLAPTQTPATSRP